MVSCHGLILATPPFSVVLYVQRHSKYMRPRLSSKRGLIVSANLLPHILCDFDHVPQFCPLLLLAEQVAFFRRGKPALGA